MNTIQVRPGSRTSEPFHVPVTECVPSLVQVEAEQKAFAERAEAESRRLALARAEALEKQEEFLTLQERRKEAAGYLTAAKSELESHRGRMAELKNHARTHLGSPLADHAKEFWNRKFIADDLPAWISEQEGELARLDAEIAAFKSENKIGTA